MLLFLAIAVVALLFIVPCQSADLAGKRPGAKPEAAQGGEQRMLDAIKWLGHASILIEWEGRHVYIDPWKLQKPKNKADLILVTHTHHDHYSPADIKSISTPSTILIAPVDVLTAEKTGNKQAISPGKEIDLGWIKVVAVPAYNLKKEFHPKSKGWVGYLLTFSGTTIYIAGDTDYIPEMKKIKADILFLPVGGTYTMDAKEAAQAVNTINPKIAIPIHFGDVVGTREDAETFRSLVKSAEVKILTPSQ
ncbi:MAG: MBL fold metallo-hydrolase [Candidatus Ratteibacteria bacterium]